MKSQNPFSYSENPYVENPFTILGVPPDANAAIIEGFAHSGEEALAAGLQPGGHVNLKPGDCARAAQCLQDPVLRLAFDLMMNF
jgi:hypothetical protein